MNRLAKTSVNVKMQLVLMVLCIGCLGLVGVRTRLALDAERETTAGQSAEVLGGATADGAGENKESTEETEFQAETDIEQPAKDNENGVAGEQESTKRPADTPGASSAGGVASGAPAGNSAAETAPTRPSTGAKAIALTFDDGPSTATTPRLLDVLRGRGVKATFFVLGSMARRAPDLVKREEAEGHEVASHTPYHHQLTKLTAAQIRAEGEEMNQIFLEILGHRPGLTRPPYGSVNATVRENLAQPLIFWSIDPRDWADKDAALVCTRVTSAARDGAIILVHDVHATTVDAVPCIIDTLKAQGYKFLTISELAALRGVVLVNGGLYYSFY